MNHHFHITKGARKNAISFYHYPLPFYNVTKVFREKIWTTLITAYDQYPKEVIGVLNKFKPGREKSIPEILQFDLFLLLPFIDQKLDPNRFENIYFVREFVRWLDWQDIEDRSYQKLREKFISKEYRYFRKLDWNRVRGKQDYDFDKYEDFQRIKEEDLRTSFLFSNESDFEELHRAIQNTLSLEGNNGWSVYQSLDIIAEENFNQNHELGFHFFESLLKNYPPGLNPLYKPLSAIAQCSQEWALKLWKLLLQWEHEFKLYWQLAFFDSLPASLCDNFFKKDLVATLHAINVPVSYLRFDTIEKFVPVDSTIITTALSIATDKIEQQNLAIRFSFHFFEKYAGFISDTTLLRKAYIQQERISDHFDLERKGMQAIMAKDVNFLFDYLKMFYADRDWHNRNTHNHLPFVWDLESYSEVVDKAANLIVEHNPYFGIGDYSLNILFSHLNNPQKVKARSFILEYITIYNGDRAKMNAIFDVIRYQFSDMFESALLHYLSLNSDLENFRMIYWRGNGGLYNGDTIVGELHAREWQSILNTVEKVPGQLDMIPIKTYIKEQISYELKSADEERKRKFIDPDW